jgi:hypothetical protein
MVGTIVGNACVKSVPRVLSEMQTESMAAFCVAMRQRGSCPTIKCDWFQHKEKHKVYRIVRRYRKIDYIADKLKEISEKLDQKDRG